MKGDLVETKLKVVLALRDARGVGRGPRVGEDVYQYRFLCSGFSRRVLI